MHANCKFMKILLINEFVIFSGTIVAMFQPGGER